MQIAHIIKYIISNNVFLYIKILIFFIELYYLYKVIINPKGAFTQSFLQLLSCLTKSMNFVLFYYFLLNIILIIIDIEEMHSLR